MKHVVLILALALVPMVQAKTIEIHHIIYVESSKVPARRVATRRPPAPSAIPTRPATSSPNKPASDLQWEDMKLMAVKVARKYDIHPSVLVGMTALESGRGTSYYCQVRNNCWGIAAYDSNPDAATTFKSFQDGLEHLAKMLSGGRYSKAYAVRHDPYAMIQEIKNAGYATSPAYVQKVTSLTEFSDYIY